jgi:hypothetical protein
MIYHTICSFFELENQGGVKDQWSASTDLYSPEGRQRALASSRMVETRSEKGRITLLIFEPAGLLLCP